jgi:hypothetical protein
VFAQPAGATAAELRGSAEYESSETVVSLADGEVTKVAYVVPLSR